MKNDVLFRAWDYVRRDHRLEPLYVYMGVLGCAVIYLAWLVGR
jgi:hypothetical protein